MILSDSELDSRLNSPDNILNLVSGCQEIESKLEVRPLHPDVGKRGEGIGSEIRKLIGHLAGESDESQKEIGAVFSVTQPFVSQVGRGLVNSRLDSELQEISSKSRNEKSDTAHDMALDSLVASLGIVKETVGAVTDPMTAAKLAEKMSKVVHQLKDTTEDNSKVKTLVVINMKSSQIKESQFETIDV